MYIREPYLHPERTLSGFDLPYTAFGRQYYPAALGQGYRDLSFSVFDSGGAVLTLWCGVSEARLGYFGFPALVQFSASAAPPVRVAALRAMIAEFLKRGRSHGAVSAEFTIDSHNDPHGLVVTALTQAGAIPRARIIAAASLQVPEAQLEAGLRKGHRQQVRWGDLNLTFHRIDAANADRDAFSALQRFHVEVAGRITRPEASWGISFESIRAGQGSAMLGYLDGKLVSGTLVIDTQETAYYATGVYDRSHFDKPLSHAAIFRSMLAARDRGVSQFILGEVPAKGTAPDKEFQIGWFKRGFSPESHIQQSLFLELAKPVSQDVGQRP